MSDSDFRVYMHLYFFLSKKAERHFREMISTIKKQRQDKIPIRIRILHCYQKEIYIYIFHIFTYISNI